MPILLVGSEESGFLLGVPALAEDIIDVDLGNGLLELVEESFASRVQTLAVVKVDIGEVTFADIVEELVVDETVVVGHVDVGG